MYGGARGKAAGIHIAAHAVQDARFAAARFASAPSGMGFGMRLVKSVHLGCVPFVTQPYVVQPFEALLRYLASADASTHSLMRRWCRSSST